MVVSKGRRDGVYNKTAQRRRGVIILLRVLLMVVGPSGDRSNARIIMHQQRRIAIAIIKMVPLGRVSIMDGSVDGSLMGLQEEEEEEEEEEGGKWNWSECKCTSSLSVYTSYYYHDGIY